MFARDVNGNLACALEPGDRVTVDNSLSWPYAGDYEVLDPLTIHPPATETSGSNGGLTQSPLQDSGEIEFTLGTYNEGYMYDTSDDLDAGWPSVPGSDPGNDTVFSSVPLANGGNFVFFTGQLASGSQFQLPSTGLESTDIWRFVFHAANRVPSVLDRSRRARMNFTRVEGLAIVARNSGSVFRSATATTCSDGASPGRMVLIQEPNDRQTNSDLVAERVCKRPCAMRPSWM